MPVSLSVELITIGDELLLGFTIDTNAAYLAQSLSTLGISIVRRATVGDRPEAIAAAVRDALDRTGAVITTGGLGPTSDDLTKASIASLFGRTMKLDQQILASLEARWRARGLPLPFPAPNRQQAMIPEGATILPNRHGSAPGIWLEDDQGRWVAMLPGVPREMRGMTDDALIPALQQRFALSATASVVRSRTLRATGIAESMIEEQLGDLAGGTDGASLAYLPGVDGVDLRLTVRGVSSSEADARLAHGAEQIRARVGEWIYAEGSTSLADVVLSQCRQRGLHIVVAESCTGGLLGARLTAMPGASDVFLGGVLAYSNDVKVQLLGVQPNAIAAYGAVSEIVAQQMAEGAKTRVQAEVGVGITGIAGPSGGTPEKPVGTTCVAVAGFGETKVKRSVLVGDREEIRARAVQMALEMIRRALI